LVNARASVVRWLTSDDDELALMCTLTAWSCWVPGNWIFAQTKSRSLSVVSSQTPALAMGQRLMIPLGIETPLVCT
jgi:hypothetical protein